jgi:hypothetical protein
MRRVRGLLVERSRAPVSCAPAGACVTVRPEITKD